jgi:ParB-like chromosome segregation protein Spo0J
MTTPKRIWVLIRHDGMLGSVSAKPHVKTALSNRWTEHEYRLVKPKREALAYVVKSGREYLYALTKDLFTTNRWVAFRWAPDDLDGARAAAKDVKGRVVRLVRKRRHLGRKQNATRA